jgi:membrane-associated protease RseP (regulator of RpoE activity)
MNLYSLTVILYVFLLYWLIVLALDRKGILKRYNISTYGPILMIRTKRGEHLLQRLAEGARKERFWRVYANIGTILVLFAMIFMVVLIAFGALNMLALKPEPSELNEPRNWLLIPGLNEFIPISAWIGFVIALVVHELSHAVLSTVEKIKVKSMGLLVALIPIGAFAEPDSEQLFGEKEKQPGKRRGREPIEVEEVEPGPKKIASSRERTRILSAGVTSNFCVAFIAFGLFFALLFALQPVSETALYVYDVAAGGPADQLGIVPETFLTALNGAPIDDVEELNRALTANEEIAITVLDQRGVKSEVHVRREAVQPGVILVRVEADLPAAEAGLTEGMRITRMGNQSITRYTDFRAFMDQTEPGQRIEIEADGRTVSAVLAASPFAEIGYLGVLVANNPLGMVVVGFPAQEYLIGLRGLPAQFLSLSPRQWLNTWLWLTVMPVTPLPLGFGGFYPLLKQLYEPVGLAAVFGGGIFWAADVLFWIGWINFYVGLFNCLPAIPLDGGYVFKELLNPVLRLGIKEEKRKEQVARAISSLIAIFIFAAIVFMLAGPYVL